MQFGINFLQWSVYRRILYISGALFVVILFFTYINRDSIFPAPTCTDSVQNGNEQGVDCGGGCALLCVDQYQPLAVTVSRFYERANGDNQVLILIENKNQYSAPKILPMSVILYGKDGEVLDNLQLNIPASTGNIIPIILDAHQYKNVTKVIATLGTYEMYHSYGSYIIALRDFTIDSVSDVDRIHVTYASSYKDAVTSNIDAVVLLYDALGNVIDFFTTSIPGLYPDKTVDFYSLLQSNIDTKITKIQIVARSMLYTNQ
jgi:hypothetical protein